MHIILDLLQLVLWIFLKMDKIGKIPDNYRAESFSCGI